MSDLPSVLTVKGDDFGREPEEHYDEVRRRLPAAGAVLVRGLGVDCPEALDAVVRAFPGSPLDYVDGNSPRTKLTGKVYTSTEHPADVWISLHSELSYANAWPTHLFFCCETPPGTGGHTTLADNRRLLDRLPAALVAEFAERGVRYLRNLHGGLGAGPSWQDTFETDDPSTVEAICRRGDTTFEWTDDGGLRLTQVRHAVVEHPGTGERCWFNQADQFHPSTNPPEIYEALRQIYDGRPDELPQNATYGDGGEIPMSALEEIRSAASDATAYFDWQQGDLLVIDNVLVSHGRSPFEGPRKILVGMTAGTD